MDWWHLALAFASFLNAMVAVAAKRRAESLQRQVRALEDTVHHRVLQESHHHPELARLHIVQQHLETLFRDNAQFRTHLRLHHPSRVLFFHPPSWWWMRKKSADAGEWIDPLRP